MNKSFYSVGIQLMSNGQLTFGQYRQVQWMCFACKEKQWIKTMLVAGVDAQIVRLICNDNTRLKLVVVCSVGKLHFVIVYIEMFSQC